MSSCDSSRRTPTKTHLRFVPGGWVGAKMETSYVVCCRRGTRTRHGRTTDRPTRTKTTTATTDAHVATRELRWRPLNKLQKLYICKMLQKAISYPKPYAHHNINPPARLGYVSKDIVTITRVTLLKVIITCPMLAGKFMRQVIVNRSYDD